MASYEKLLVRARWAISLVLSINACLENMSSRIVASNSSYNGQYSARVGLALPGQLDWIFIDEWVWLDL